MRPLVALFFLFVFSFQMFPVKALGRLIAKAQMTEEVKQCCDDDGSCGDDDCSKDGKDGKDDVETLPGDLFLTTVSDIVTSVHTSSQVTVMPWLSEELIHLYKKDIHCPPPNC